MSGLTPLEKLELRDILSGKGFEFEKRKIRKVGTREINEIQVGTRVLDSDHFGMTVIGIDLDTNRDMWFVAPTWEASQISTMKIHEIKDEKLKLAASAFISRIKEDIRAMDTKKTEPEPESEQKPELEETIEPGQTKEQPVPKDRDAEYEQVIKNISQAKVSLTKNTKGYNWEISAYADSLNDAIDQAIAADQRLRTQFGVGV